MPKKVPPALYTSGCENASQALTAHFHFHEQFKQLRADLGQSATQFGVTIGERARGKKYSRSYIKKLEGGSSKITVEILRAYHDLREATPSTKKIINRQPRFVVLLSRYDVPEVIHAMMRPRKCRGHRQAFFMQPTQVYCGRTDKERAACRKLYDARKKRRHARKKKKTNRVTAIRPAQQNQFTRNKTKRKPYPPRIHTRSAQSSRC